MRSAGEIDADGRLGDLSIRERAGRRVGFLNSDGKRGPHVLLEEIARDDIVNGCSIGGHAVLKEHSLSCHEDLRQSIKAVMSAQKVVIRRTTETGISGL